MGCIFSLKSLFSGASKQQRVTWCFKHSKNLIPSLPNDISLQILARVPRVYYLQLMLVSRSWMEALSSTSIYNLRRELNKTEELLLILELCRSNKTLVCYTLDPVSRKWQKLPPLCHSSTQDESDRGLAILLKCNSFGSRIKDAKTFRGDPLDNIPSYGCSIAAVNGCLYLVGGFPMSSPFKFSVNPYSYRDRDISKFSRARPLRCVWRYDPILNVWNEMRPMLTGRAYGKTGVVNNKLYVVGGITRHRDGLAGLQSAEVFDPETNEWSAIPNMPCSKAQVMATANGLEGFKPTAAGLTPYKGKLYVPQSLCHWPYCIKAGGEIYDPETNSWVETSSGMFEGWPDKHGVNRLSVIVDDELYALDVLGRNKLLFQSANINVYDKKDDSWKVFSGKSQLPSNRFNAESPYLLASFGGKLHVINKNGSSYIAVHEARTPLSHSSHSNSSSSRSFSIRSSVAFFSSEVSWKFIASIKTGLFAELITCQVLRI